MKRTTRIFTVVTCVLMWVFLLSGYTDTIDTSLPAFSDDPAEADDNMRRIQGGFQEILAVEHNVDLTGTVITGDGKHTDITSDSIVNAGALTQTGIATFAVPLVFTKGIVANNAWLTATDNAGTGTVNLISANVGDRVILGGTGVPAMSTTAAATSDSHITNKKHVDDLIAAQANTKYAQGWARVSSDGTKNASYNVTSVVRNSTGNYTVTWDTDFSSADYVVMATIVSGINSTAQAVMVSARAAGSCTVLGYFGSNATALDSAFDIIAFGAQ